MIHNAERFVGEPNLWRLAAAESAYLTPINGRPIKIRSDLAGEAEVAVLPLSGSLRRQRTLPGGIVGVIIIQMQLLNALEQVRQQTTCWAGATCFEQQRLQRQPRRRVATCGQVARRGS